MTPARVGTRPDLSDLQRVPRQFRPADGVSLCSDRNC
nr:MAG TPA: hypothetical protein [Caudoviricetes sp.]